MLKGSARAVAALATVALAVVACGKKGPPVSPERRLPLPASALHGRIEDGAIIVDWTIPRARVDGSALKDLDSLRLYRHEESEGAPLKPAMLTSNRVAGYEEIAHIRLDSPAPAVIQRDTAEWTDRRGLTLGHRYVYVVTARDSTGRTSPPSQRLVIPFLAAAEPPRSLRAVPGDREVALTWNPPETFTDGTPVTGQVAYQVLRGAADGPLVVVSPGQVTGTSYTDKGLENDAEYRFAVRAVRVDPRVSAVGPASDPVIASPIKTTPPSPPGDLAVVPSAGAMRLAWKPSPEEDVAFYAVYRATGGGAFTRIGTAVGGITTFIDHDVVAGTSYRYAVTAIDRARKPNESAHSNEAAATAP